MTHTIQNHPRRKTASARNRRHAANFSDAVVAVYIHEISARHRRAPVRSRTVRRG